jgi:dephospho-CoA kinase
MGYTVALTGGIGSGKSTVADAFARFGVDIVDADVIARQVVEPGSVALQAIAEHFGSDILTPEGSLNRRLLRERIFASPAEKTWLNGLLHPLIHQQTQRQIAGATSPMYCGLFLCWLKTTYRAKPTGYWLSTSLRRRKFCERCSVTA